MMKPYFAESFFSSFCSYNMRFNYNEFPERKTWKICLNIEHDGLYVLSFASGLARDETAKVNILIRIAKNVFKDWV